MSLPNAHNPPEADIAQALADGETVCGEQGAVPWWMPHYPMPVTSNRIILAIWIGRNLSWGIGTVLAKTMLAVRAHPWRSVAATTAFLCSLPVCKYMAGLFLAGCLIAVARNVELPPEEEDGEAAPERV
ncbi:MAG: hypothetical protein AB7P76_09805 [Candidatus Melainabacteria bacterium]